MNALSEQICARIRDIIADSKWNQKEIAECIGISQSGLNQMLTASVKFPLKRAIQVMDLLHVPDNEKNKIISMINERDTGYRTKKVEIEPVKIDPKDHVFPVISEAAAISCNTSYIPIADFAVENSDELRYFDLGKPGDFAIRITGDSMLPWYPPGTLVLIRPHSRPKNGQRVIAVLGDGDVVFKIFSETRNHIHLLSINDHDGVDLHFEKDDYQAIRNLFVVIQSVRDELKLDEAMDTAGIKHRWQNKIKDFE